MSNYKVYDYGRNTKIVNVVDEKGGLVALVETRELAKYMVGILNQETAPLHETIAEQAAEIERLRGIEAMYRDDIKTMIDGAAKGWTVDRLRRYAVEVMQGIVKREDGE